MPWLFIATESTTAAIRDQLVFFVSNRVFGVAVGAALGAVLGAVLDAVLDAALGVAAGQVGVACLFSARWRFLVEEQQQLRKEDKYRRLATITLSFLMSGKSPPSKSSVSGHRVAATRKSSPEALNDSEPQRLHDINQDLWQKTFHPDTLSHYNSTSPPEPAPTGPEFENEPNQDTASAQVQSPQYVN
ncbi:hypothetical protein FMEXI_5158 [Fusarium mexicanum]|uniref:Uncharacterized protein n=1 Tax=Fusarium mexicanum TaxID=751941 RepID=A0A8H5N078_9HYPO|nr:hypothetical protein FMEXI_5158 [Fusarium mexicanum]